MTVHASGFILKQSLYSLNICVFTVMYAPWWRHVEEFWDMRHDENILFLTYEDLKRVKYILTIVPSKSNPRAMIQFQIDKHSCPVMLFKSPANKHSKYRVEISFVILLNKLNVFLLSVSYILIYW